MVIMCAYKVQIHYAVCGVLQRQLKLAVHDGHFDLIKWVLFWQGGNSDWTPQQQPVKNKGRAIFTGDYEDTGKVSNQHHTSGLMAILQMNLGRMVPLSF